MQWEGISGGFYEPVETLGVTALLSQHTTLYPNGTVREFAPSRGTGGMLEIQALLKSRKGEQQGTPVTPLPTSAGILRPLMDLRAEQLSRRSDHVSTDTWTTSTYTPCDKPQQKPLYEGQANRVERPQMQMPQSSWDPLGPQFQGYGASHALPTEYMLTRRSGRRSDQDKNKD